MLLVFSGSAGCGKNTIMNKILEKDKDVILLPSLTTRSPRPGESNGHPYYFTTKEDFENKIKNGEMIEYMYIHNSNYYGMCKSVYEECLKKKPVCINDIDVVGFNNAKKMGMDIIGIYIDVEKDILKERLIARGTVDYENRLKRYDFERAEKDKYDYVFVNNTLEDFETMMKKVLFILEKEKKKRNIK